MSVWLCVCVYGVQPRYSYAKCLRKKNHFFTTLNHISRGCPYNIAADRLAENHYCHWNAHDCGKGYNACDGVVELESHSIVHKDVVYYTTHPPPSEKITLRSGVWCPNKEPYTGHLAWTTDQSFPAQLDQRTNYSNVHPPHEPLPRYLIPLLKFHSPHSVILRLYIWNIYYGIFRYYNLSNIKRQVKLVNI